MTQGTRLWMILFLPMALFGCGPSGHQQPSSSNVTRSDAEQPPADCTLVTEWLDDAAGVVKVHASACTSSDHFPSALESALRKVDPSRIRRLAVVGPGTPQNKAALAAAWIQACRDHSRQGEDVRSEEVLDHYRESGVPAAVASVLRANGLSLELARLDNFYPLRPRDRPVSDPCDAEVPLPMLWFAKAEGNLDD